VLVEMAVLVLVVVLVVMELALHLAVSQRLAAAVEVVHLPLKQALRVVAVVQGMVQPVQ
jgi:hypothetical protein